MGTVASLPADSVVVLDFETTGLSPNMGDRAIEIGAVRLEAGQIVDRYQALMDPGIIIPAFIEDFTGITNAMIFEARPCEEIMQDFRSFMGSSPLVAHNASFDRRFFESEYEYCGERPQNEFACSLLVARRIYQDASNHKLATLVKEKNLPTDQIYHRALADAEMTAHLWMRMYSDICQQFAVSQLSFEFFQKLGKQPKAKSFIWIEKQMKK